MLQIKELLTEFGINCGKIHVRPSKYNSDKYTFILFISNQKSIINFYKNIGFLNREKQSKLQKFLYRIYVNGRIRFNQFPVLLSELKDKLGTDRKSVEELNRLSRVPFTCRQFEHMRRGELRIPIQMVVCAIKILNKKEYFEKIPMHFQDVIRIYEPGFP